MEGNGNGTHDEGNGVTVGLAERLDHLEHDIDSLRSQARAPGDEVIFRPPLWSQESAYSAADDRRLITATLWPGVTGQDDCAVTQRAEGANLSVDVAPGHIIVQGTEQYDQGHYLCPLAQRINIPLAQGPSGGYWRWDFIVARVYEPVDQPAYFRVETVQGHPVPPGTYMDGTQEWGSLLPNPPPSITGLALVGWIDQNTTQVLNGLPVNARGRILDMRRISRPPPIGNFYGNQRQCGPVVARNANMFRWGVLPIRVAGGTPGQRGHPVGIEGKIEGVMRSETNSPAIGRVQVFISAGPGPWSGVVPSWSANGMIGRSEVVEVYAPGGNHGQHFCRSIIFWGYRPFWAELVQSEVGVAKVSGADCRFHSGLLTLKMTPGAETLAGRAGGGGWLT